MQVAREQPLYGLTIWREGRMVELECCFCNGNCIRDRNGRVKAMSGLSGLRRHLAQIHYDREFGDDDWLMEHCVRHELTIEEEQMVRDGKCGVRQDDVQSSRRAGASEFAWVQVGAGAGQNR